MKFQILNRWTGSVIFESDNESMKLTVSAAVDQSVSLRGANLRGANLRGANLRGADLSDADLSGADLSDADLRVADLSCADLGGANLRGANLRRADLRGANLRGANLRGANLRGADLSDADLSGADLTKFRDDVWAVLSSSPREVPALREAIISGRINGSAYEGECACLVGTLANARGCKFESIPGLAPDSSRLAETWFIGIKTGDTPETNPMSKLALEWVDEWLANMRGAFAS